MYFRILLGGGGQMSSAKIFILEGGGVGVGKNHTVNESHRLWRRGRGQYYR